MVGWFNEVFYCNLFVCEDIVENTELYYNFLRETKGSSIFVSEQTQRNAVNLDVVLVDKSPWDDARGLAVARKFTVVCRSEFHKNVLIVDLDESKALKSQDYRFWDRYYRRNDAQKEGVEKVVGYVAICKVLAVKAYLNWHYIRLHVLWHSNSYLIAVNKSALLESSIYLRSKPYNQLGAWWISLIASKVVSAYNCCLVGLLDGSEAWIDWIKCWSFIEAELGWPCFRNKTLPLDAILTKLDGCFRPLESTWRFEWELGFGQISQKLRRHRDVSLCIYHSYPCISVLESSILEFYLFEPLTIHNDLCTTSGGSHNWPKRADDDVLDVSECVFFVSIVNSDVRGKVETVSWRKNGHRVRNWYLWRSRVDFLVLDNITCVDCPVPNLKVANVWMVQTFDFK